MYDFHIHSDFSVDCKYLMEEMVQSAVEKGIKSICFTDHIDYDLSGDGINFEFRPVDYFKKINQMKYKYMGQIEILSGVEIGMQPHLVQRYNGLIDNHPFDFVIMSIHSIDKKDIYIDQFTRGKKPMEALNIYYDYLYNCLEKFDNYDVVGHIDYIDRYFEDFSLIPDFKEYSSNIENILKIIIEKGKGLEVNTAGMRYKLGYYNPKAEILKLYKELGGEIVTIGSDAHNPEHIGYHYREAEKMLRDLGFKYTYIYRDRKKVPIHIN
ncbi:MAG TPA: histidinol-phosphatase HisJ family protein [Tepidimicrobium sp.]|nr:histidinol-phosphatase HisJ family protein [Tepidimicrobium sp.]